MFALTASLPSHSAGPMKKNAPVSSTSPNPDRFAEKLATLTESIDELLSRNEKLEDELENLLEENRVLRRKLTQTLLLKDFEDAVDAIKTETGQLPTAPPPAERLYQMLPPSFLFFSVLPHRGKYGAHHGRGTAVPPPFSRTRPNRPGRLPAREAGGNDAGGQMRRPRVLRLRRGNLIPSANIHHTPFNRLLAGPFRRYRNPDEDVGLHRHTALRERGGPKCTMNARIWY